MRPSAMLFLLACLSCCCGAAGFGSHVGRRAPATKLGLRGAEARTTPFRQKLENRADVQYYARITLGGQPVDAIFDTGSFDVLVQSQRCAQCPHPQYNSSASGTYHSLGVQANHTFGSGPTFSHMGEDDMRVGPLHVEKQVIHEIVSHEIKVLDKAAFDAIVGIGAKEPNSTCNMSLLCNLNISEFSICLERGRGAPGWLTWGSSLTEAEKAGGVELANIGKHHWAVSMRDVLPTGLNLNAKKRNAASVLLCGKGCAAIIDSGTSLIAAPSHSLNGLGALLPLEEDCSNWHAMPDLEFTLNGRVLRLSKESYVMKLSGTYAAKLAAISFLHFKPKFVHDDVCFLSFITMDRSTEFGPLWILGMPFFRQYHVTFGLDENATKRKMWLNGASPSCEPEPLPQVGHNQSWELADAVYKGAAYYPRVIVAQEGSKVQHSSAPAAGQESSSEISSGPITMRAEDLLANLRPRLEMWSRMESL